MLDMINLVALAKATAKADKNSPVAYSFNGTNYSYSQLDETLRKEMNELVGTPALYRENKNLLFGLIEETISEVLPVKVADIYAGFAEVKNLAQGDKPIFRRKISSSKIRAKQFITRVGLAGRYEVFKLGGSESFEVKTSAVGGAAQIGIEEFLDGRVDFAELVEIVMDGIEEVIQIEVGEAMKASIDQLPSANKVVTDKFNAAAFDNLLAIADSYGKATIYCDSRFAATIMPAEVAMMTEQMKNTLWEKGYFTSYKNHNVVILPNGLKDEQNNSLIYDPSYAWIIPTGANSKPAYIAIEGATLTKETDNDDWSKDIQVYKKVGVGVMLTNDVCVYRNTSLSQSLVNSIN
jgi:hypothetical protein